MFRQIIYTVILSSSVITAAYCAEEVEKHLLYVGLPGVRDDVSLGGEGIAVFDIDREHAFVKRIPTPIRNAAGKVEAVKGICASAATKRLYFSTPTRLICIDLSSEKPLWEKSPAGGCDRMAISPDGKIVYVPSFEGPLWNVIDADTGETIAKIEPKSGAHNTNYGLDGTRAYLAGLKAKLLTVADTRTHTALKTIGPFSASIRPFTINGAQTLCFACVNDLLGFEIGDLESGKMTFRVEVPDFKKGPVKYHGCPSHGIALTPDEKEIWVDDAFNKSVHVFDATVMPPKYSASIKVRDESGWVTFGIDGRFAYPSTGDVIDTKSRTIVAALKDENGKSVHSEKLLEIDFSTGACRAGDQFGVGRVRASLP